MPDMGSTEGEPILATTDNNGKATLRVTGQGAGTVVYRVVTGEGVTLAQRVPITIMAPCGKRFADVNAEHPACRAIEDLAARGVVTGTAAGFEPDRGLTRAELAVMLVRALGLKPEPQAGMPFSDTEGHWAAAGGYLQAAVKAGAFSGMPDGTFRPNAPVTRAQLVKVAAAAAGLEPAGRPLAYTDVAGTDWYAGWVESARKSRLIGAASRHQVYTTSLFGGDRSATRAEAAMLLANILAAQK